MKRKFEELKSNIVNLLEKYESESKKRKLNEPLNSSPLKEELICPVTREVYIYPVTLDCGHTFEASVLNIMETKNNYNCSLCNKLHWSVEGRIEPNYILMNIIDKLYPEYRSNKIKDENIKKPKEKSEDINGSVAVKRIEKNKGLKYEKILSKLNPIFERSIKKNWTCSKCKRNGHTFNVLKSIIDSNKTQEFIDYTKNKKNILFEFEWGKLTHRSKKNSCVAIKFTFLK